MIGKKGGMHGKSGGSSGDRPSLTPQRYLNPKHGYKGPFSKPNNDGNLWTRRSPTKKPGWKSPCFITTAVTRAAELPDDCYELSVLRMFRREYVAQLPDGERVLSDYEEKAPKAIQAIDELSGEDSQKVWECLYVAGIVPAVLLITSGNWDEAYRLYRSMCEEVEAVFLKGHMNGHDPERWVSLWIEAKLSEAPLDALEGAARSGIMPLEGCEPRSLSAIAPVGHA